MSSIIELRHVNKTYKRKVLDDCTYSFPRTGLYAIYGVSGSGKSTLLNLLAGFEKPDSGEIRFGFRGIEYVMQEHMLLTNCSLKENLWIKLNVTEHSPRDYDRMIHDTCARLNIDHLIEEKVAVLSGGEKQRASLARALLDMPEVILLDEPTASIDHDLRHGLLELLLTLSKERLLIVTTHDPLVNQYADITLQLERGRLLE
ncbi:ATP-binding cassette domain-containing protein [Paenibacillus xylaniclasticus]|uniref:ATP-binding cassette domain-containing protein n=1 Tax=Paenibacillus xylaniclasticus TaxID=588083 RepID=UPI000FDB1744|nr:MULTISPECIES: ATP-binding cassette domain-containing protein [Paenibacillus]GFN31240.1 ABC transporter ATP-binding protein YxdL [Paenibacillus curdlanolyticus]